MKPSLMPRLLACLLLPLAASALDLAAPGRSDADHARDRVDHPEQVLEFAGVKPGMTIADIFAGSGYYAELLGQVVGPEGRVLLHNNRAYLGFVGQALEARLAGGRLPNVQRLDREADALGLAPASLDGVLLIHTVHDFWYEEKDWHVKAEQVMPQLFAALKPGGFLLVIDHRAEEGSGTRRAQDLHRIEESAARAALERFGFEFVRSSGLLDNDSDERKLSVFDPQVRGHTDRFVHLYRRPL